MYIHDICSRRRCCFFFFQAEDGIRDLVRSRGLGDVYKRQYVTRASELETELKTERDNMPIINNILKLRQEASICLLYTSDAADERSSVDLGGRRIIKKKKKRQQYSGDMLYQKCTHKHVKMHPTTATVQ